MKLVKLACGARNTGQILDKHPRNEVGFPKNTGGYSPTISYLRVTMEEISHSRTSPTSR